MAVNRETLALLDGMRVSLDTTVDATTRELVRQWGTAWNELRGEWQAAIDDLVNASTDGRWPTRAQIVRAERAQRALAVTRDALDNLAQQAGVTVVQPVTQLTGEAAAWHARIIGSQIPSTAGSQVELAARFARVDPDALAAIVDRATGRIESTLRPLSREAAAAIRASLIRGVAVGDNPRETAARMLRRVQGDFAGGLTRALTIARTEQLSAHRAGGLAQDKANADVLNGWRWTAALDTRTCPACLAMHGSMFEVDKAGPDGHPNCRCARTPVTKSWRELGFDIDEPPDLMPDSRAWFDALPEPDQVAVMGAQRLELLRSGAVSWEDLATLRRNPEWRDSWQVTPVRDLRRRAAA